MSRKSAGMSQTYARMSQAAGTDVPKQAGVVEESPPLFLQSVGAPLYIHTPLYQNIEWLALVEQHAVACILA